MLFRQHALIPFLTVLVSCATTTDVPVPASWMSTPVARRVGKVELTAEAGVVSATRPRETGGVRIATRPDGQVLVKGEETLTPPFVAIQSFDVSMERREIAFSAKRKDGFDIGLVSLDGSPVNWVPEETLDETDPRWATRGNKFSYVLRSSNGDLVRTIHVPTSVQLTIDFPNAVVNDLAWDALSERFAVVSESADASESVEVMKYSGEERRRVGEPAAKLNVSVEPFAADALVLRPSDLRYEERLPLVVWLTDGRLNAWSDARAALMNRVRVASIVTTRIPDAAFWEKMRGTAWMDAARVFIVDPSGRMTASPAGAIRIAGSGSVRGGQSRRDGSAVLVSPAVVESFAVGFVDRELKGTSLRGNR